jgi:outer membrane protein assembly factor BamB
VAYDVVDGVTIWTRDLSGGATAFADVVGTPIVTGGGLVVAAGYSTGLHGVDVATGMVTWRVDGEGFGAGVLHEDIVYVVRSIHRMGGAEPIDQGHGAVVAIDASTGVVYWTLRVGQDSPRRPAFSAKYVFVPVDTALLVVDRGSGRVIRQYDDFHGFSATPSVAWGRVYAQANSGIMYAFGLY